MASIPGGVIDQYLAGLQRLGFQGNTVRNRDIILKGFFEWLTTGDAGKLRETSGYESGIKTPSGKRKMPRFVTKNQAIFLIISLYNESQRCVIHLMYDSGLRVSEVPRITKKDIDALDHWPEQFTYLPLLVRGSKGRGGIKERYCLISRAVYSRIKRYHNTPDYRFARFDKHKPAFLNTQSNLLTAKAIQKMVLDANKRAGMQQPTVSPHRLRH
ncbi:MAG TPA: tyrosine-type recombinase/integrase, partial [Gammaproteobacteria bacterium]